VTDALKNLTEITNQNVETATIETLNVKNVNGSFDNSSGYSKGGIFGYSKGGVLDPRDNIFLGKDKDNTSYYVRKGESVLTP
jgi:hypothetical protein